MVASLDMSKINHTPDNNTKISRGGKTFNWELEKTLIKSIFLRANLKETFMLKGGLTKAKGQNSLKNLNREVKMEKQRIWRLFKVSQDFSCIYDRN